MATACYRSSKLKTEGKTTARSKQVNRSQLRLIGPEASIVRWISLPNCGVEICTTSDSATCIHPFFYTECLGHIVMQSYNTSTIPIHVQVPSRPRRLFRFVQRGITVTSDYDRIHYLTLESPPRCSVACHVDRRFGAQSLQASWCLSGLSGCSLRASAPPVMREGGMLVGKSKGYNLTCAVKCDFGLYM